METNASTIRVAICGALGKMGREAVRSVLGQADMALVAAFDRSREHEDVGVLLGFGETGAPLMVDMAQGLALREADVVVDLTRPEAAVHTIGTAIEAGARPVVGTTGISSGQLEEWDEALKHRESGGIFAPNFSIGAILQMRFAAMAAKYLPNVEIIELHHDKKRDAPSGTALRTAELILRERPSHAQGHPEETETHPGARGAEVGGMRIHSVRLPGYVAHQEVLFGGPGQSLSIRHDVVSREEAYMPGLILAIRRVRDVSGLVRGLEHILE